jgi:hypothetical protein
MATSTIVYDSLVRADISCTSAFVPVDDRDSNSGQSVAGPTSIPLAICSRGIVIRPDTVLGSDLDQAPVSPSPPLTPSILVLTYVCTLGQI